MSVTTTAVSTLSRLSLTGDTAEESETTPSGNLQSATETAGPAINPQTWPSDFRLVPPYRPINRNLDQAERPYGANMLEFTFITVMLAGVRMQSVNAG